MSRAISFSRTYPAYHPKAGHPTYFVEKIIWSLHEIGLGKDLHEWKYKVPAEFVMSLVVEGHNHPKFTTIRAGHRWKEGDLFKPVVWGDNINPKSGRSGPYHSKQIQFAPEIQIKKIWDFDIHGTDFYLDTRHQYALTGAGFDFEKVAMNDALDSDDLFDWFQRSPKFQKEQEFHGQIICWSPTIDY